VCGDVGLGGGGGGVIGGCGRVVFGDCGTLMSKVEFLKIYYAR
jgi:hypothetical protein